MRRVAGIAVAMALAVAAVVAATGAGSGGSGRYRVDAILDNSGFLAKGQDVKVAGAAVGSVTGFGLTKDNKARIEMEVDRRFAPFHRGATCNVQPQSLIGERFVECSPGDPSTPDLAAAPGSGVPTVPLASTSTPVDLDLVLSTFRLPVRQRLSLLLSGLGAGVAGRGGDLNATLRRANPALGETRRVLDILNRDRFQIRSLVSESDRIFAALARRKQRVGDFVRDTGAFTSVTADRRAGLAETIRRLPPLLRQARPSLDSVSRLAAQGTPLARDLRASATPLDRLTAQIPGFSAAARPALRRLGQTAERTGTPAVRALSPQIGRVRTLAGALAPTSSLLRQLLTSVRTSGTFEGVGQFVYLATLATARFDGTSHVLGANPIFTGCETYSTTQNPSCDSHLSSSGQPSTNDDPRAQAAAAKRVTATSRSDRQALDFLLR